MGQITEEMIERRNDIIHAIHEEINYFKTGLLESEKDPLEDRTPLEKVYAVMYLFNIRIETENGKICEPSNRAILEIVDRLKEEVLNQTINSDYDIETTYIATDNNFMLTLWNESGSWFCELKYNIL